MNERPTIDLHSLSARVDVSQVAKLLGFQEYQIPILMRLKYLRPLGAPAQNGRKFFSAVDIVALGHDPEWLDKATRAVDRHINGKPRNGRAFAGSVRQREIAASLSAGSNLGTALKTVNDCAR